MCAGILHGWACIISADNQSTSTPGYKAASFTTQSPIVGQMLKAINHFEASPVCLPATELKRIAEDITQWPYESKFDLHIRFKYSPVVIIKSDWMKAILGQGENISL